LIGRNIRVIYSLDCCYQKRYNADKVEFLKVLARYSAEPEHAWLLIIRKHTCTPATHINIWKNVTVQKRRRKQQINQTSIKKSLTLAKNISVSDCLVIWLKRKKIDSKY